MIDIKNLNVFYNRGSATEIQALRNISINILQGEYAVVVGSNGSGKSTLLNAIAGSIFPQKGEILINQTPVTTLQEHQRSKYISRVFQNPLAGTAPDLSILDNFRLAALRTRTKSLKIGIDKSFKQEVRERISVLGMGLENKPDQLMKTLSGGQRQALTLLMSVMDKGNVLLLDEPTAALDPRSAKVVMETADRLIAAYNLTAILITHNMKEAQTYGRRIIQMQEGEIIRNLNASAKANLSTSEIYEWFL